MPQMRRRELLISSASALLALTGVTAGSAAHGASATKPQLDIRHITVQRSDEAVTLTYELRLDLTKEVEDVLTKGIALVFVAEAETFRSRWYWTDKPKAVAVRKWRLAYQPLTRQWRLSSDETQQHFSKLSDALSVLKSLPDWRISDALPTGSDNDYYVDFRFRLDIDELPRPLQISLGIEKEWDVAVERRVSVPPLK